MKRLLIILLGITFSFAIVGCGKENENENTVNNPNDTPNDIPDSPMYEVDYYPIEFVVSVCDAEGNDLLDSASPSAINLGGIKMLYNGEEYTLNEEHSSTRAYEAYFYGIKIEYDTTNEKYELWIGEFNGDEFFDNIDITIDWGDGRSDILTLYNKIVAPYDGEAHIDRRFYLNGEQVENNVLEIVR